MLMIRLQRHGKRHQPYYRLAVGEKRSKLRGEQLEDLGWYNPRQKQSEFNKEKILYWMKNGAKLSPTVHNLLVDAKIISGKKVVAHKTAKKKEGEVAKASAPAAAAEVKA
jgi:small subunit ribosomal protein S16